MEEINTFSLQILLKPLVFTANDMFQYDWNLILLVSGTFIEKSLRKIDVLDRTWNNYINSDWNAIHY